MKEKEVIIKHCASRVMALAVLELFPNSKLGEGGPLKHEGFFYDFELSRQIHIEDLEEINNKMRQLLERGIQFRVIEIPNFEKQPFKEELLRDSSKNWRGIQLLNLEERVLFEDIWEIEVDKIESLELEHFLLTEISGAFFEGDSKNKQLTRISGIIAKDLKEFEEILEQIQRRRESDHKIIGKQLNIFTLNHFFGQGFVSWLEDGTKIKKKITKVVDEFEQKYGFDEVITPPFGSRELYEISGHLAHYQSTMFPITHLEHEELVLRPMTCPHHIILFKSRKWSYRELPKRYAEHSRFYRLEASGALSGLERVRGMELSDGHIFLRVDQIQEEINRCFKMVEEILKIFKIQIHHIALSTREKGDKEKYAGDDSFWETTEAILRDAVKQLGVDYVEEAGEAAFYGPKIDIQIENFLGKILTISTIQLDFVLPKQFEATYINQEAKEEICVMIHRGLVGTYERFMSILLEQTKGFLPFWLSPRQVRVIPVQTNVDQILDYAQRVYQKMRERSIDVSIDLSPERLNKKILVANTHKYHYLVLIGNQEVEGETISVRKYNNTETNVYNLDEFINHLVEKNRSRED